jgi:membrane protease YdiL (CAAX protease family)
VLSPKPWKLEAVVRLLLKLFICMCAGWLLIGVLSAKVQPEQGRGKLIGLAILAALCLAVAFILLHKSWTIQNFLSRAITTLAVFYVGLVLTAWAQHLAGALTGTPSVLQMVIAMVSLQGAAIVLVTLFLKEQGSSWREGFGFSNHTGRAILIGIVVVGLFIPIGYLLQAVIGKAVEYFTHDRVAQQEVVKTIHETSPGLHRLVLGILTLVLAPLGEETLFRGILYTATRQAGFPRTALWLTSIVFAGFHINFATGILSQTPVLVPLFILGLTLAILYEKTDNLLAPMAAHIAFNMFGFIGTLLSGSA